MLFILFPTISNAGNWVAFKEGITSPTKPEIIVVKEDASGITLDASILGMKVEARSTEHGARSVGTEIFQLLSIPGHEYSYTQEVGKPKLPFLQILLAIPDDVEINLSSISTSHFPLPTSYLIYPVPKQVIKTTPEGYKYIAEEFYIDEDFYKQDIWYPQEDKVITYHTSYLRDQRILYLQIHPIQFNPAKNQLQAYSNLKIEIKYMAKKGRSISLKQSKMAEPFANVLQKSVLNYLGYGSKDPHYFRAPKRIGTVTYPSILKSPNNSADYLIITSSSYYHNSDVARLAEHRAEFNGFDVAVVNTTSIYNEFPITDKGTTTSIKDFIRYVYYNWSAPSMEDNHLGYILIFGDGEETRDSYVPSKEIREIYPTIRNPVSDPWYACINDEDLDWSYWTVDIMIGRLPVETGTDAKTMVDKTIGYEKTPELGQWRNKILLVTGEDGLELTVIKDNYLLPAGFEVAETTRGDEVFNAIDSGQLLVSYSGHGVPFGWATNPAFSAEHDVSKLSNRGKLPVVLAAACDTACFQYDYDYVIGETFLTKENGGAIAYWGASDPTGANTDIFIIKAYQFIADYTPNTFYLGQITLNTYFQSLPQEWNLLGDPALTISRVGLEPGKAELEVEPVDIRFNPQSPKPGQQTNISAIIHNLGDIDAKDVLVQFFLGKPGEGGMEIGSKTIPAIKSNDQETAVIDWKQNLPIGEYPIYVIINPYNTILEAGTINNTTCKSIEINFYQEGYPKIPEGGFTIENSPVIGDVDGDEDLEVMACAGGYVYIWHHNGSPLNNWYKIIPDLATPSPPLLAEVDNDDGLEVIKNGGGGFYILRSDGSNLAGFPISGSNTSSPALGDIDGDGDLEIAIGMNNKFYLFHHTGELVKGDWPIDIAVNQNYHPMIADIDRDGHLEIIVLADKIYVFNSEGKLIPGQWPKSISGYIFTNGLAIGNIDNDDELEILIVTQEEPKIFLHALNYDGTNVTGYPKQVGGMDYDYPYSVTPGDIDNDKEMEIIIDCRKSIYVLNSDGSDFPGWPKGGRERGPSYPVIANVDGDKVLEIIESRDDMKGTVTIWNNDGTNQTDLFLKPGDKRTSPFVVGDMDLDGDIEVICGGEDYKDLGRALPKIYIWDYWGSCTAGALEWPMANHDMRRTNCYNTDIVPPSRITDLKALNPKPTSIDLTWTAPGDDKDKGSSTCYYIRYATWTITPQNWHLTNKATSTIVPKDAGSPESFTVPNLCPTTTYYFCIRARDDDFNLSPLSNITFEKTLSPAMITLISPTRGVVGKRVTISGCNFYPTETIRIEFGNTTTIALSTCVGGSFTTTFTVNDQGFGTITITAYGLISGYEARASFYITAVEYFLFATISSPQIAGTGFRIKMTAYDEFGDVVLNFKDKVGLSDLSQTIQPTITSNFTDGIWDGTVSITRAGTSAITAGYQSKTGTSNPFYVWPGEPVKFIVYPENPIYILAGGSVSITAQLSDVYGNAVGSAGISCNLEVVVLSGKAGTLSATTSTTTNTGQINTITYWVSPHANDKVRIKLLSTLPPATSGTITTTSGELAMFTFDTIATQTAGMNFPIKITARDAYENPIPFTRTVTLIDFSNSLKPTQTTSFIDGLWAGFGSITVRGTTSITVIYGDIRGTSNTFWVCGGEVEYFVISSITTQTAGISFPVSINAYDRWRNIADMFNSSAILTDTSHSISPTKTTNFSLGIWDGTASITKAGTTTIMAGYQGKTGTSNPFFITPSSLDHFLIGTITNQIAGIDFPVVLTAKDAYNNTVSTFTDKVQLEDTSLTLNPKITDNFVAGIWDSIGSITRTGTTSITASYQGKTGTSNPFLVSHNILAHFLMGTISNCVAGVPFPITIMAQDSYGNTMLNFSDKVQLEDSSLSLNPKLTTNFVAGIWDGIGSITRTGTTSIMAGYQGKTGTSNPFLVSHNRLDHFLIGTISNCLAGIPFPITIMAQDSYGNTMLNFSDKVQLEDTSLTLNPKLTTNFMAGIWDGIGSITRTGTTSIMAGYQGKTGTSNPFLVQAGSLSLIKVMPGSVTLLPDESQLFTSRGYDGNGNEKEVGNGKWEVGKEIGSLSNIFGTMTRFTAGTKATSGIIKVSAEEVIGTANIRIVPGKLAKITILPKEVVVEVAGTSTFTAYGYDKYGNEKEVGNGKWEVGSELGKLTNVIGTNTTFVAGTKPGKGTLTYTVREAVMNLHLTNESVPLGMWIKGEERNNLPEPRAPNPEPRAPSPESRAPSPESRFSEEIIGTASITVRSGRVSRFDFDPINHQIINTKFGIKVTALDRYGNLANDYNQTGYLTTNFGQIKPTAITFKNGISTGTVMIETNKAGPDVRISLRAEAIESQSNDFAVLYDDASNVKVEEGGLKIDIKSHSVSKDYYLKIDKPGLDEDEIKIANLQMNHYNPGFCLLTDTIIRIVAKDGDKKPIEGDFGTRTTRMMIYYHQPPKNVAEETLKLYILDEESIESRWVEIANAQVLIGGNFVYGNIPHFGTFILIGEGIPAGFDGVVVYPNPFKPSRGDENIVFEGLPEDTQIRIYDISGSLVKDEEGKRATWIWDVRNNYGKKIDSGVYIYVLTTGDGKKKTGKIAIIR
ncbi:MAG: C25 family cysteine peptidase [bacterium]